MWVAICARKPTLRGGWESDSRIVSANAWLQQERGLYTSCGLFRYALYHGRAPEARFDEGR